MARERDIEETPGPVPIQAGVDDKVTLALVVQEVRALRKSVESLEDRLDNHYVTRREYDEAKRASAEEHEKFVTAVEFWPVKAIVFSGAGIILVAVLCAVVYLVVRGGQYGHAEKDKPTISSDALSIYAWYP